MDAEDLLLREFLGIRSDATRPSSRRNWIRSQQRADGSWAHFHGGPPDLSTTIEAYVALRLAGDPPDAAHMRRAARARPRRRRHRARRASSRASGWRCSALWSWDDLPALPPEVIFLPPLVPAQHLRLRLLGAADDRAADGRRGAPARAARSPSASTSCAPARAAPPRDPLSTWARPLPAASTARCTSTSGIRCAGCAGSRCASPASGSSRARRPTARWGGIQPPWVYSLMALHLLRLPARPPRARARRSRGSTASRSTRTACAGSRPVSRRSGTPRSRWSRCATRASRRTIPRSCARADWLAARGDPRARRLGGAAPAARAGRLGVRVRRTTTTPTSTTPPRSCSRCARATHARRAERDAPRVRAASRGRSACSRSDDGWARVRRRQHARALPPSCRSATSAR